MLIVVTSDQERTLLRTHPVGRGVLNALFAELYCSELAYRSELIHKISISFVALLSTGAVISLSQLLLANVTPYLAVASSVVSILGMVFAWRSQALSFATASRAYADHSVEWSELWEALKTQHPIDDKRIRELQLEGNKIGDIISPHRMNNRLARRCQRRIRRQTGLTTE